MAAPLFNMSGIEKRFGATIALAGVDLEVEKGRVHALIGENGAGKSTLMKILSGALLPDGGSMTLAQTPYRPTGPHEARRKGVAMIYQELTLAPHLTVEANVMLGMERHTVGFLHGQRMRERVGEALALLQHPDILVHSPVRELGLGACQLVEVARALAARARVIVMDEPTSALSGEDTAILFQVIRKLKSEGVAIIYISHFLEEVKEIADTFTVLRDGKVVGSGAVESTEIHTIVEMMVGRKLKDMFPKVPHKQGEPLLRLTSLQGRVLPCDVSLTLRRGEILGIAGLVGSGRSETLRTLFGLEPCKSGAVEFGAGLERTLPAPSPRACLKRGIGLLSENRKEEGLALPMTITENTTLSRPEPFTRWGFMSLKKEREAARYWAEYLDLKHRDLKQPVRDLSGGNQQKVALARLLHHDADIFLMDEPTRGIDIGSKVQVYQVMGELAARGKGILFVSSYLPELLGICDRIAVMHRGRLSPARPAGEWTEQKIMDWATRGES